MAFRQSCYDLIYVLKIPLWSVFREQLGARGEHRESYKEATAVVQEEVLG